MSILRNSALILALPALLGACSIAPDYPAELVRADSLYLHGNYAAADSLLAAYDSHPSQARGNEEYHRLMQLEQAYFHDELSAADFSMADSLFRYYRWMELNGELARAQLFLGQVYLSSADYPAALEQLLASDHLAQTLGDTWLSCIVNRQLGDLYSMQFMLDECVPYFRNYYALARQNGDAMRTALASHFMGIVFTHLNEIDSTIFYYKQAIAMKNALGMDVSSSVSNLCDIYNQIEQFDEAERLMVHDERNDWNWAYWHYGQNHVDSAIYYFSETLGKYGWRVDVENLKILADLERQRGNDLASLAYREQLSAAEDSLKATLLVEETLRAEAHFHNAAIKQQRDDAEQKSKRLKAWLLLLLTVVLVGSVIAYFMLQSYRRKRRTEFVQEQLLRKNEEEKYRKSLLQLEANKREIERLEAELQKAVSSHDEATAEQMRLSKEVLMAENKRIEGANQLDELLVNKFKASPIYTQIMLNAGKPSYHLNESEWLQLANSLDETYDGFTQRLLSMANINELELRVCYLLKLGVRPVDIAEMVGRTKSTISMMCGRIYQSLTQGKGSAKQLGEFLRNF